MKDYVVRFIRVDGKPDEEYYYNTYQEAYAHKALFDDDDSGLYKSIEVEEPEVTITPSYHGELCQGSGEDPAHECRCDECDYYLECFPDWKRFVQ